MISTSDFAKRMKVNYRTALNWLRKGHVPGASEWSDAYALHIETSKKGAAK